MYHMIYLAGLCQRRKWPEPYYDTQQVSGGYTCVVRVNNREYSTDTLYPSEEIAREAAATRAYTICRSFSVNDGMVPRQQQVPGGVVQGLPVAIGTGRRRQNTDSSEDGTAASFWQASSSPQPSESGADRDSRPSTRGSNNSIEVCGCGRGTVQAYSRCRKCMREAGWQ